MTFSSFVVGCEQQGKVCHSGSGQLTWAGGGNALQTDKGGHFWATSISPWWDPDQQRQIDCSGTLYLFLLPSQGVYTV